LQNAFGELAPEARKLFEALPAVEKLAPTGFPAFRKLFRDDFPPLLGAVDPFVPNFNPIVTGLGLYKREVTSFFGYLVDAKNVELTETDAAGQKIHYLRTIGPINPESLASYPSRLALNRASAYNSPPGWAKDLLHGLPNFNTTNCNSGLTAELEADTATNPASVERSRRFKKAGEEFTAEKRAADTEKLLSRIRNFAFGEQSSTAAAPTPPCRQQQQIESIFGNGEKTQYQHTFEQTARRRRCPHGRRWSVPRHHRISYMQGDS
jgi:hypothetical protein